MIPSCIEKEALSHLELIGEMPKIWLNELPVVGFEVLQVRINLKTQCLPTDLFRLIGEFEMTATLTCQTCQLKFHDWLRLPIDLCPIFETDGERKAHTSTNTYWCQTKQVISLKDLLLHALRLQLPMVATHTHKACLPHQALRQRCSSVETTAPLADATVISLCATEVS